MRRSLHQRKWRHFRLSPPAGIEAGRSGAGVPATEPRGPGRSGPRRHVDIAGLQHLQPAELGGCGEPRARRGRAGARRASAAAALRCCGAGQGRGARGARCGGPRGWAARGAMSPRSPRPGRGCLVTWALLAAGEGGCCPGRRAPRPCPASPC